MILLWRIVIIEVFEDILVLAVGIVLVAATELKGTLVSKTR